VGFVSTPKILENALPNRLRFIMRPSRNPSGLKPRPGVSYFAMERTDPCWTSITRTKSVGLYVPDSIEQSGVAVHVLDLD